MSSRDVRLVFLSGPEDGKELTRKLPVVFGRFLENDVPLPYDALCSRKHARLVLKDGDVILEDLGSSNGTFLLTGQPIVTPTPITPGTHFRVGGVWLRLIAVSAGVANDE